MRIGTALLLLLGVLADQAAYGQNLTPDELIRAFFTTYETGRAGAAIDQLYASNTPEWLAQIQGSIDEVRTKFEGLNEIVGKYYGKEKLLEESLGECFRTIIYLVRYDRQPIRFTFQYYRPGDRWRLYGFSYDDDLPAEQEERLRQRLIEH